MAIREDEDVAQAMGINLVMTKLLAFSTGALFAGLAGTLGAAKLTSVYPHSMTFLVSINVLVLIIIGGMGSIPGVFVGALVLVGLPGILTEFQEYRLWFYGLALVLVMIEAGRPVAGSASLSCTMLKKKVSSQSKIWRRSHID
jgi:branched-chain amino acid transport system permease protein